MKRRALANAGLVIALGGLGVLAARWAQPAPRPPSRAAQLAPAVGSTMLPSDEADCQAALEQRATELYSVGEIPSTPAPALRVDRVMVRPGNVAEMDMPNVMHRIQVPTDPESVAEMDMPHATYKVQSPTDPESVAVMDMPYATYKVDQMDMPHLMYRVDQMDMPNATQKVAAIVATLDAPAQAAGVQHVPDRLQ